MNIDELKAEVQEKFPTLADALQTQITVWAHARIAQAVNRATRAATQSQLKASKLPEKPSSSTATNLK